MALTVTEANAVNTVLNGLSAMADEIDGNLAAALEILAQSAHARLMAGWTVGRVSEQWPNLTPTQPAVCSGLASCTRLVDATGHLCPDCRTIATDAARDAAAELSA